MANVNFRTPVTVGDTGLSISHRDGIMMLGSCFSDNIGAKLRSALFNVSINPLGTIYNPMSLANAVSRIVESRMVTPDELFLHNGVWNCFDFHSRYSLADKDETQSLMNASIHSAHGHLASCSVIFVTLGTAITFSHNDKVVCNCHKLPSGEFLRKLESAEAVTEALLSMVRQLHEFNHDLRIVFTVSPIRHIADGLATNSLSKSILRVAINNIIGQKGDICSYFPAYEILMDDLRDYRFYASDMVHPSEVAVDYIWDILKDAYFDESQKQVIDRCERMAKRLNHRPMSHNQEVVAKFRSDTEAALHALISQYPYLKDSTFLLEGSF